MREPGTLERIVKVIERPARRLPRLHQRHRMKNLAALTPLIAERLRSRASAEWIRVFEEAGVPVGPVNKIGDMLADPQVHAREMVVEVDHPKAGRMKTLGTPIKFSDTKGEVRRAAPVLGQHTARCSPRWARISRSGAARRAPSPEIGTDQHFPSAEMGVCPDFIQQHCGRIRLTGQVIAKK